MKLVLLLSTLVMFLLTRRYNETDFIRNRFLDVLVQLFHIIILFQLFYIIICSKNILLALFCAYTLIENIKWLLGINVEYEYVEDETDNNSEQSEADEQNNKEEQ